MEPGLFEAILTLYSFCPGFRIGAGAFLEIKIHSNRCCSRPVCVRGGNFFIPCFGYKVLKFLK